MPIRIFGRGLGATDLVGHKNNSPAIMSTIPASSSQSWGSEATQTVGFINRPVPPYSERDYALFRFDISALAGEVVNSAVLRLFLNGPEFMANQVTVNVERCITQWGVTDTDAGITHSPAAVGEACYDYAFTGSVFPPPPVPDVNWASGGQISLLDKSAVDATSFLVDPAVNVDGDMVDPDVTAIVQSWLDGTNVNHGFFLSVIVSSADPDDVVFLYGHDALNAEYRPALVIDYGAAPVVVGAVVVDQKMSVGVGCSL